MKNVGIEWQMTVVARAVVEREREIHKFKLGFN